MALRVGELFATLRLDDGEFRRRLDGAQGRFSRAGHTVARTGSAITKGVSLPLAGVAATALKMGGDFEAGMNGVKAVTGATGDDFDKLSDLAKKMGSETQFSASDAANAMEFLGMTGFKTTEIMSSLPDVLNLAAAGNTDLARTADIASNIMSGFGIEASDSARVADVLAQTMRSANVDLDMLGESMKYAAPIAKAAGWSFEDTAGAVGLLGNAGIQGSAAGTGLNSILATLADTTSAGGRKLKKFGVEAMGANGKVRPLTDIMQDLKKKGADVADVISIFGLEAGPKLQAMIGQGSDGLQQLIDDLTDSKGTAKEMADIRMEGFNGSVKGLQSAFEGLMIAVAESGLLEWGTKFATKLTSLVSKITKADSKTVSLGAAIGGAAIVVGPLIIVLGKLISAFGSALTAIGKFARGVATATAAIARMTVAAATYAARIVVVVAQATAAGIRMAASAAATAARVVAGWAVMGAQATAQATRVAAAWLISIGPIAVVVAAIGAAVAAVVMNWDTIKSATGDAWNWITSKPKAAGKAILKYFLAWSIVGFVIQHWDKIKSGTVRVWNSTVTWIKKLPGRIGAAFASFPAVAAIARHWQSIKSGTVSKATQMLNWVKGIPRKILGYFSDFGTLLYGAGRDLMRGLYNGVKSMGGWVSDKLKSLVKSAVPGPIKSVLGIHSPSTVMRDEIGKFIPAGIVEGIEAGTPAVDRTMQRLVSVPTPQMAMAGAPAMAGTGPAAGRPSASVHIEHWHAGDQTPDQTAAALEWRLKGRG